MAANDWTACADLCEYRGLERPAEFLRAVGSGTARAYIVHRSDLLDFLEYHTGMWWPEPEEDGRPAPGAVFLDREAAESHAMTRDVRTLDRSDPGLIDYISDLSPREFCERVGAILGIDYPLPPNEDEGRDDEDEEIVFGETYQPGPEVRRLPPLPDEIRNDQLREIVGLYRGRLYEVVAIPIAP